MASRAQVAVLEPTPPNTLNTLRATSPPPSKRRKTSHAGLEVSNSFCTSQFTIRPHDSPRPSGECHTLTPITLLRRARLPLSWLGHSGESRRIQSGKLFVANIPALERDLQTTSDEPVVLAARLVGSKPEEQDALYVVERVKRGIYAICALGNWVEERDLLVASRGCQPGLKQNTASSGSATVSTDCGAEENNHGNWLERARLDDKLVEAEISQSTEGTKVAIVVGHGDTQPAAKATVDEPDNRRETCNLKSIGEAVDKESYVPPTGRCDELCGQQPAAVVSNEALTRPDEAHSKDERSQQEILDGLRKSYLDALYVSKTSLAYFAKGPLSRTRAAYQTGPSDSSLRLSDLCAFYRDTILPTKKMDMKYRDTLPEVVRSIPPTELDNSVETKPSKPKRRNAKRRKVGKNGLYAEEHEYIANWWRNRSITWSRPSGQATENDELKHLTADLRVRETQLQILIILETMALESTNSVDAGISEDAHPKPTRSRKSQDLNMSLELLLDKLCIWHTLTRDDMFPGDSGKKGDANPSSGKAADNDKLRDFCMEVVIPFYAARLPEQCWVVSHKLGGPISSSPARPQKASQPTTVGAEPQPDRPRRTLQRVVTDENVTSRRERRPSLRQPGSSAPTVPALKRESSEPVILSQIKSERGGIQKPRHLDNREVDLDTVAKQHETKLKKVNTLLEQKKELDAAINALRKPNRELVSRDFADTADRRSAANHPRKPKNPTRNPQGQKVQVMATPKGPRKKDCGGGSGLRRSQSLSKEWQASTKDEEADGSDHNAPAVPSSASRPTHPTIKDSPVINRSDNTTGISETPSKVPSQQPSRLATSPKVDERPPRAREGLFRVPSLPNMGRKPRGAPTTLRQSVSDVQGRDNAVERRRGSTIQDNPDGTKLPSSLQRRMSCVQPQQQQRNSTAVPATPTKTAPANASTSAKEASRESASTAGNTTATIYDQLGWNDDDDDDDELAL